MYPEHGNMPKTRTFKCGITGTGAAHPTKRYGNGITVTRTGVGVFRFSFADRPGVFLGFKPGLGADTMSAVKGYSVTRGAPAEPSGSTLAYIDLSLWDASNAAVELAAAQYLDVEFEFSELSIG